MGKNMNSEPPPPYPSENNDKVNEAFSFEEKNIPIAGDDMNSQPVFIQQPVAMAPTVTPTEVATNQGPAGVTTTTTTTTQNTLIVNYYGLVPVNAKCPSCQYKGITTITKQTGTGNWIGCGGCCLFGCWLGCQAIPFCIDSLKDTVHHCSSCGLILGIKTAV